MARAESLTVSVLLTAMVALGPISTDLYLPSLPSIGATFATDNGTVQLTLSVFLADFAVSQLVYGPLSDRFGRRPVILAGVALYLLASIGCALAPSRSEEHTSELQSLMRISYAVFCLKKTNTKSHNTYQKAPPRQQIQNIQPQHHMS